MNLEKSKKLNSRANEIIPGGTNTNSKRVDILFDKEHFPAYIDRGKNAHVWDIDGNEYIDYIAALAPINIGYNIKRINDKIKEQLKKGILFSLPPANEVALSELLIEKIPCAKMVKILKTGAEATAAAIRAARLQTGKEIVLSSGYHGWHDWWAVKMGVKGIPECYKNLIYDFPYNDYQTLERLVNKNAGKIATIILTPSEYGIHPKDNFLQKIRKLADDKSIILIFDEIITGFRWAMGGAQEKYGVVPDLSAFGKSMANGMPISVLVGKKELMAPLKDSWITSTFASEALSIAASLETIKIIEEEKIIERLYSISSKLYNGLIEISENNNIDINVFDLTPAIKFEINVQPENKKGRAAVEFIKSCTENGVRVRKYGTEFSLCIIATLTDEDIYTTLNVFNDAVKKIKSII